MFSFKFKNALQWVYGSIFKNEGTIIWKVTITGPFVTFYATGDSTHEECYQLIGELNKQENKGYNTTNQHLSGHHIAHHENLIERYFRGEILQYNHTHYILPCRKNLIEELEDLLKILAKYSQGPKKYIDVSMIEPCIDAYQNYLATASLDNAKNDALNLLFWMFSPRRESNLKPIYPNKNNPNKKVFLNAVTQYLGNPKPQTYEELRENSSVYFEALRNSQGNYQQILQNDLEALPKSSLHLFNEFVNKYPYFVVGSLLASLGPGLLLKYYEVPELIAIAYALSFWLYAPTGFEKCYTAISEWLNQEDGLENSNGLNFCHSD